MLNSSIIISTRPSDDGFCELVSKAHMQALWVPLIKIQPIPHQEVSEALQCHWIVFQSKSGIRLFREIVSKKVLDESLSKVNIAVQGTGSAKLFKELYGFEPQLVSSGLTAESLTVDLLAAGAASQKIALIRGKDSRAVVENALRSLNAEVRTFAIYETMEAPLDGAVREKLLSSSDTFILTVFSPSITNSLLAQLPLDWLKSQCFAAFGEITANHMRQNGLPIQIENPGKDLESFVKAIREYVSLPLSFNGG